MTAAFSGSLSIRDRLIAKDEEESCDDPDLVAYDSGIDGGGAPAEEAAVHVVDEEPGEGPEPRSGRVAEAREHPPETAVLRPGQLGEGEPEVAVEVGPEPQCPEAGAG